VLNRADWDADAVRDARRTDVIQHLADPHSVLGLDETGVVNKGRHSAGVARQYTGTVGTVEHGHLVVCLGDARVRGQVLLDRELSLPAAWTQDRERCRQAGIPADRGVATTPPRARQLLARAFAAGVPAPWGTGDWVSGEDRRRRRWLEARPQA
jgi:SRSO17 transposase